MTSIVGIYRIPEIQHVFFITEGLPVPSDSNMPSSQSKLDREYFERILQQPCYEDTITTQQWTQQVISKDDLMYVVRTLEAKRQGKAMSFSFSDDECLQMLTIGVMDQNETSMKSRGTKHKGLCMIPEEDLIEVFI